MRKWKAISLALLFISQIYLMFLRWETKIERDTTFAIVENQLKATDFVLDKIEQRDRRYQYLSFQSTADMKTDFSHSVSTNDAEYWFSEMFTYEAEHDSVYKEICIEKYRKLSKKQKEKR